MIRRHLKYDGDVLLEETFIDVDWIEVRRERNQALADSDWTAVKDRTMSQDWKDYRTALRDLPQDHEDANSACDAWPQPPE